MQHFAFLLRRRLSSGGGPLLDPDLNRKCLSFVAPGGELILDIASPLLADRKEFAIQARLAHPNREIVVPIHPTLFSEEEDSPRRRRTGQLQDVRHIVCVSSGKGGVGKSTVAVNMAAALSQLGARVGIFDADLHGPSLPTMMVAQDWSVEKQGKYLMPLMLHGIKCQSFGFCSPGTGGKGRREELISRARGPEASVMRGPMASKTIMELVLHTKWGELDFLIVDLPPGTSDIHLSLMQDLNMDAAVVVTTPQELSFVDVARGLDMLEQLKVPVVALVENMAWFVCRHGEKHFPFGNRGEANLERLSKAYGITRLTSLPILAAMAESGDSGLPFMFTPHFSSSSSSQDVLAHTTYLNLATDVCRSVLKLSALPSSDVPKLTFDVERNMLVLRIFTPNAAEQYKIPPLELRRRMAQVDRMLNLHEKVPDNVVPLHIEQRGNYAATITWSDGHSKSIYPYQDLKRVAKEYDAEKQQQQQ